MRGDGHYRNNGLGVLPRETQYYSVYCAIGPVAQRRMWYAAVVLLVGIALILLVVVPRSRIIRDAKLRPSAARPLAEAKGSLPFVIRRDKTLRPATATRRIGDGSKIAR